MLQCVNLYILYVHLQHSDSGVNDKRNNAASALK